ncbi:MAG: G8 domain-containing protein [Nitrospirota bacterium]
MYGSRGAGRVTLIAVVMLAGCATSGDVEQVRQEREQASAKMRAELEQERTLAASMEKESQAKRAEADKLAAALGGGAVAGRPLAKAPAAGQGMSLTTALATSSCIQAIQAQGHNPPVPKALFINSGTSCGNVTVSTADTTAFTAQTPLIPVVVGAGGTLAFQDPGAGNSTTLYASSFLIQNAGIMQAGSAASPIQGQITIVMAGNQSAALAPTATGSAAIVSTSNTTPNSRDITVMDGGVLQLYGSKGLSAAPGTMNNDIVGGTKSWTYLTAPAGPATYNDAENVSAPVPATNPATTLTLATTVDWQKNDWISVATTSFSSHQTEIVQICAISSVTNPDPQASALGLPTSVSQITLCSTTPLKHYHYGGLAPTPGFFPANTTQTVVTGGKPINVSYQAKSFYDDHTRNYGIDERAEVALLSRNIKLTSVAGQTTDANNFIGGHLVAMVTSATYPTLKLVGVEIEKFGQGLTGRYPVHLHMLQQLPSGNVLVQDVSVHHSYNKCYVPHQTPNAKFYNNVCVRTVGQGMYLEDGSHITGNQFMRNHIAGTMTAQTTYSYPPQPPSIYWDGDNLQSAQASNSNWYNVKNIPDTAQSNANANPLDSTHPGGFWITNLGNTFVNNSVAGCQSLGRGYWLLAQGTGSTNYPEFTGNRVHGCYNGIDNDDETGNTQQPYPMLSNSSQYAPVLVLTDNTITRSRNKAAWFRNWYVTLHNHRFATNLRGFSLLVGGGPEGTFPGFWGLVYQNVIAGMTRNNVERYPVCKLGSAPAATTWQTECTDVQLLGSGATWGNYPSSNTNVQGYSYYDGPARIEHNRFLNFRFDPTGIHATDQAARLLTKTDIQNIATYGTQGQLEGLVTQAAANAAPSSNYKGYVGDVANGWQTSNAQTVPPTQYIRDSIWDNVDFKHQVYTEAVNMGPFNDGDKTTVIRDLDSQLSGLRVVDGGGHSDPNVVPISLNSVDYFATDFTVDEPHSRGPNDFRSTSLMSPHKYATLNIESVNNPPYGGTGTCPASNAGANYIPTCFRVVVQRDMPAYGDTVFPSLFLNGRGQLPIYEPFVMDRMGYVVYGAQGTENNPPYTLTALQNQLLFSYTDPGVKKTGEFFVNRVAVYQPVTTPANIKVYRIRRQWGGQLYGNSPLSYPPNFIPPGGAGNTCDGIFSQNQSTKETKWQDCLNRARNVSPYAGGMTIPAAMGATQADQWKNFEAPYKTLMAIKNPQSSDIATFIANQTFFYDTTSGLLYFYMIEDKPVQSQYSPFGTCDAANYNTGNNYVSQIQKIKAFSDPNSVQAALDASCLVSGGAPHHNDLFVCNENGCAAYLVDFSTAVVTTPTVLPSTPPHPISRTDYSAWNQYHLVYGTPAQQPNGVPVPATAPTDGTALPAFKAPVDGTAPPTGNNITYNFLPLSGGPNNGGPFPVTENFRYHCVITPPWAPVNARGTYPAGGGTNYHLAQLVCQSP